MFASSGIAQPEAEQQFIEYRAENYYEGKLTPQKYRPDEPPCLLREEYGDKSMRTEERLRREEAEQRQEQGREAEVTKALEQLTMEQSKISDDEKWPAVPMGERMAPLRLFSSQAPNLSRANTLRNPHREQNQQLRRANTYKEPPRTDKSLPPTPRQSRSSTLAKTNTQFSQQELLYSDLDFHENALASPVSPLYHMNVGSQVFSHTSTLPFSQPLPKTPEEERMAIYMRNVRPHMPEEEYIDIYIQDPRPYTQPRMPETVASSAPLPPPVPRFDLRTELRRSRERRSAAGS